MRSIDKIVIHCSATMPSMDIGVTEIDRWHKDRGWTGIGYHYVIRRNGDLERGRPDEKVGAHVYGHNANSIGICLVGGISELGESEANYTNEQYSRLRELVDIMKLRYPNAEVIGHYELDPKKDCPCFDVRMWWENRPTETDTFNLDEWLLRIDDKLTQILAKLS